MILARRQIFRWILAMGLFYSLLLYWNSLPEPLFQDPYSPVLEDADGHLLGARVAEDGQWRFPATRHPPEKYRAAVLLFEDKRFYHHGGVDLRAILRAIGQNVRAGRVVSGGSTLSMQVIRLALKNPPRTLIQKIREVILATRLELRYTKKEIFQLYAAHAPFGGNVVGLDAASWRYFGKNPDLMSWSEAALLAVLPNRPGMIHPGRSRIALRNKRNRLLGELLEAGHLDTTTYNLACAEPLPPKPRPLPRLAPHLLERLVDDYRQGQWNTPRVTSSLQRDLQQQLLRILEGHGHRLSANQIHNIGAIVLHVPTGKYVAYAGNAPTAGAQQAGAVDVVTAPRSTGSILKPFLYALAMQEGYYLSQSLLPDYPVNYRGYRPKNYGLRYGGAVPADRALMRSLNVPFVHLLEHYGLSRFQFALQKMGLSTLDKGSDHYGLTLILGGAEARLDELTRAYAAMAYTLSNYGDAPTIPANALASDPVPYDTATQSAPYTLSKLNPGAIWKTFQAMQQVERPADRSNWAQFSSHRRIAWKTGTSFGFRDAWAIGVTPEYAVGIWVGNAGGEGRPELIGIRAAGPILFDVFDMLPSTTWWAPPLEHLNQTRVCRQSGFLAGQYCPTKYQEETNSLIGGQPCPYHDLVHLDESRSFQVDQSCYPFDRIVSKPWFVIPARAAHYYRQHHPDWKPLPPFHPDCAFQASEQDMQLIYPQRPRRIRVPRTAGGAPSRTVFEVAHIRPEASIFWHLDDRFLGTTQTFHVMELNPSVGEHLLTLVDDQGNRLEQAFEVVTDQKAPTFREDL